MLIHNADDLLSASSNTGICVKDTKALLVALVERGHWVSPDKLQFCKEEVEYLGYL